MVIPALGKPRQEDQEFKANLNYIGNSKPACATVSLYLEGEGEGSMIL